MRGASEPIVELDHVTRRFGRKVALDRVSLRLERGSVLGLVGENGAGKTTLIRHLLGLLRPDDGSVRVFGRDPAADPVGVLSRVGYLSEEADLPAGMRIDELLRYCQAFYATWDPAYARRLVAEFELNPSARIRTLSKGQRARAGLVVALAYRPELLVLDEPSSGLDPIVRRDILAAVIRTIADEGRSVLFSSHLLSEVERVADRVAMIAGGRVLFCDTLETLLETHVRGTFRFEADRECAPTMEGALLWEGGGREWSVVFDGTVQQLEAAAALLGARLVEQAPLSLDEIFMARAGGGR
jgi:ABC-2 type transport system ATP-binding protein